MPTNMGMQLPPPKTPEEASLMDRIANGLLGPSQNYGGLLDMQSQKAAQQQGLMAIGQSLLANSGWSPNKTTFGQALGPALQAGQQSRLQSIDSSLNAALLASQIQKNRRPTGQDAKSIQEYEYAKQQGFTGSFEEWKRVASAKPQSPAGIQEYEYFQKLTPDQRKEFLSLQRSPVVPQVVTINGVPTLVDRTGNAAPMPLSTQDTEISAVTRKAEAESQAKARGTATGEAEGGLQKRAISAGTVLEQLELAEPLIDAATGSTIGAGADKLASFFGASPSGDQAIAQLKIIQAALMTNMPRMEGPQSDRDVQLYREAAGELGDATVPRARKRAALKMITAMQEKYAEGGGAPPSKPKRVKVDLQGNIIGN